MNLMPANPRGDALSVACQDCSLFQLALPVGRDEPDWALLDRVVKRRRLLERGEPLFQPGDPFLFLYAVKFGSLKTYVSLPDGHDQITGFHLPGELLGLDAIDGEVHPCGARALEPTGLCEVPLNRLEELGELVSGVQRQMLRIMSRQLLHDQRLQTVLCRQNADERLAAFLLSLSDRLRGRGFDGDRFRLSMTRADIGNYLGVAKETVSRLFTRFERAGLLAIEHRQLRLLDRQGLAALAGVPAGTTPFR